MDFEKKEDAKGAGEIIGFIAMYFIFTTILYFILKYLNKLPLNWTYFYVVLITILIVLLGKLLQKWLN